MKLRLQNGALKDIPIALVEAAINAENDRVTAVQRDYFENRYGAQWRAEFEAKTNAWAREDE